MAGENDDLQRNKNNCLIDKMQREIEDLNNEINLLILKFNKVDSMRADLLKENEILQNKLKFIEFIIKSK